MTSVLSRAAQRLGHQALRDVELVECSLITAGSAIILQQGLAVVIMAFWYETGMGGPAPFPTQYWHLDVCMCDHPLYLGGLPWLQVTSHDQFVTSYFCR